MGGPLHACNFETVGGQTLFYPKATETFFFEVWTTVQTVLPVSLINEVIAHQISASAKYTKVSIQTYIIYPSCLPSSGLRCLLFKIFSVNRVYQIVKIKRLSYGKKKKNEAVFGILVQFDVEHD